MLSEPVPYYTTTPWPWKQKRAPFLTANLQKDVVHTSQPGKQQVLVYFSCTFTRVPVVLKTSEPGGQQVLAYFSLHSRGEQVLVYCSSTFKGTAGFSLLFLYIYQGSSGSKL